MTGNMGRGLGLGPVFAYEGITASRRWQGYALRSLFVLMLLAALLVVGYSRAEDLSATRLRSLAAVGELFYTAVVGTQLTLVLLAAPAATAGAICLDRARGTLTHLLVTDLTDSEIVLGKLAARLVPVLGLVGCTLPVTALLTLLGGVDPDAMLGAFVVTVGVAVLGCGLALAFSLWAGKTHEALLGTYAVCVVWLLAPTMVRRLNAAYGGAFGASMSLPMPPRFSDPFLLAFAPYWYPGAAGWGDYLAFLAATCGAAAALAALAMFRLRAVCARENSRSARPLPRPVAAAWEAVARGPRRALAGLPGPSLDGNPVFWREWHRARPSRWARGVAVVYGVLAAVFSLIAATSGGGSTPAWVNGLQVSVGLLLLSVASSTSLAEERVRGSLDVLLTTPLSTSEIVLGKWLGTFRFVPLLAVLPSGVVLFAGPHGLGNLAGASLVFAFVLCSGAAVTSLGLGLATWCSRLGRAVGLAVTIDVLITVGWVFLIPMLQRPGLQGEGLILASPFFWAGEMSFEFCGPGGPHRNVGWGVFWTVAYALTALGLLLTTLSSFNRFLGRVEGGLAAESPYRKPVVLTRWEEVRGESTPARP